MPPVVTISYGDKAFQVRAKPFFRIARLAFVGLLGVGVGPSAAGQAAQAPADKPAAATPAPKNVYSATRARQRRQTLAQARAAASAREMAETVVPRYKVDASGDLVPDLRAAAAIIFNPVTGEVLWEENSQSQRSIASITKVMTAIVFLENAPDLTERVTIALPDVRRASTTYLRSADKVTTGDLMHLLLIASDNAAARALARVSPYGSQGFIERMNEKAAELGLVSTRYADPSGLLSDNLSSAYDMARLIAHASADRLISSIMQLSSYSIQTPKRRITFRSTNHLLGRPDFDVMAGKTGFISKSGYCLATLLRLPQSGVEVAVVVLGARSNAGRFLEVQNMFNWLSAKASSIFAQSVAGPLE